MMTVFEVLMILCGVICFLGFLGEAYENKRKMFAMLFGVCSGLFLIATIVEKFL